MELDDLEGINPAEVNPAPQRCERGPARAVQAGQFLGV